MSNNELHSNSKQSTDSAVQLITHDSTLKNNNNAKAMMADCIKIIHIIGCEGKRKKKNIQYLRICH